MNKPVLIFVLYCLVGCLPAQVNSGRITFERKTNLYKKFSDNNVQNWIREEERIKIDYFELYFNDTCSLFKPQENELKETNSWATSKNSVYQNYERQTRYMIKTIWGEELHLTDSIPHRKWKVTDSNRKIAGYPCRKAVWQVNDSTRIYAWFSYDLVPSTGPESFSGLPGTILGLATEDGGVVYFAKKVELIRPTPEQLTLPRKKKVYTVTGLKEQMTKQYGKEKWFKAMLSEQFGIW